jgi:hypothetical protein
MPAPDPDASDWSDLDLLTVSEATERLDEEIASVHREIATLTADSPLLGPARRRLELLHRARDRASSGSVVVTPGRVRTRAEVEATPGPPD